MNIKLSEEIARVRVERDMSIVEMGTLLEETNRSTLYHLLHRDNMKVFDLYKISEVLNFNFFELIKPNISQQGKLPSQGVAKEMVIHLKASYSINTANNLAPFVKQVVDLANKYGLQIEE